MNSELKNNHFDYSFSKNFIISIFINLAICSTKNLPLDSLSGGGINYYRDYYFQLSRVVGGYLFQLQYIRSNMK